MKTFKQFRNWMRFQMAWDEFMYEYNKVPHVYTIEGSYFDDPALIINYAFDWVKTKSGYKYWSILADKWFEFYYQDDIKKYKLIYIKKRIASVEVPKNSSSAVKESVKSLLQEKHPTITDFEWLGNILHGSRKEMKLKEIKEI